ncbi:MAG: hypothetical protein JXR36_04440 [Bacteroidales bacterium]|nr:hypothetical protein [Bacteroidales bacterium]
MKIDRNILIDKLVDFSQQSSGLIIGDPGIGKSFALAKMAEKLIDQNIPIVLFRIDTMVDGSDETISSCIGCKENWLEFLNKVEILNKSFKAVLIFDAFDATRDFDTRKQFLKQISLAKNGLKNWNILVSVRKYDARKSPLLNNIFNVSSGHLGNKVPILEIESLNEEELESAFIDNQTLGDVYRNANENLKTILKIPFYLRQLELVLLNNKSLSIDNIKLFKSESEILDKLYEIRIATTERGLLKESMLKKISDSLVKNRTLTCEKSEFIVDAAIFEELRSDGIISEVGFCNRNVAFSHNILFDYFIGRLSIPGKPDKVLKFLNEDKTRAFFLRPSLIFHYTGLWYNDRTEFWKSFNYFLQNDQTHIDLFKRLVLISVAACEFEDVDDIRVIINNNNMLRQLFQSLRFLPNRKLANRDVLLLLELSKNLKIDYLVEFAIIFNLVLNSPISSYSETRINCGIIARNFMKFIMANRIRNGIVNKAVDNLGSNLGVTFIAKTFETNVVESQNIFLKILEFLNEENFNINYFAKLARNLEFYGAIDVKFTCEIYKSLFTYEEESNDTTYLGGGVLLPFTSTRKQDFSLIHNYLFEYFDIFLSVSPEDAIEIGLKICKDYVLKKKIRQKSVYLNVSKIEIGELHCEFLPDMSSIWDDSLMTNRSIELTTKIIGFLGDLLKTKKKSQLDKLIPIYLKNCYVAYTWKKLLRLFLEDVVFFKGYFYKIISNSIFLYHSDTVYEVGQILKNVFSYYSIQERNKIENHIVEFYTNSDMSEKDFALYQVIKLINCIPETLLTNPKLLQIKSENDIVKNEPIFNNHSYSTGISETNWLELEGVNVKDEKVASLISYKDLFRNFNEKWINQKPNFSEFEHLAEQAVSSFEFAIAEKSIDEKVINPLLCEICKFYSIIMWKRANLNDKEFDLAKKIIMHCIDYQSDLDNVHSKELSANTGFSPTPRIEASNVISVLYQVEHDELIFNKILQLSTDENPIVRFHVLKELFTFYDNKRFEFWQIVMERLTNEQNSFNLGALLKNIYVDKIVRGDLENLIKAIDLASLRVNDFARRDSFLEVYVNLLLYLHDNNIAKKSEELLYDICRDIEPSQAIITKIFYFIDPKNGNDYTSNDKLHSNLFELLKYINKRTLEKLVGVDLKVIQIDDSPEKDNLLIVDYIIQRIYFTLIYQSRNKKYAQPNVTDENKIQFYLNIKPIVEEIINASPKIGEGNLLASTADYLLEIFNGLFRFKPSEAEFILKMTYEISKLSKNSGYLVDDSSIKEIIKITEALFADHKDLLMDSDNLEELISILNIYVEVGWPQALELLWRIDEVFK